MRCLVVYSSITGNTKAVAEAIHSIMPEGTPITCVQDAPPPNAYDFLALGFWVNRAQPDPAMQKYMQKVQGKKVGLFGTLAAYPDSDHARQTIDFARGLLDGNEILGSFLCLGRLEEKRMAKRMAQGASGGHPMTPERKERLLEAAHHPNEQDFVAAQEAFAAFLK